jgi:hypothetical protein
MAKFTRIVNGVLRSFEEAGSAAIYDQFVDVASPIIAGTNITLPGGQTYKDDELEVYLNGTRATPVEDYVYVGSPPRTQIQFTFDLVVGDRYRFRVDRGA